MKKDNMKKVILLFVVVLICMISNKSSSYADEELNHDNGRSFIFIGDSYQEGNIGDKRAFSWLDYLLLKHRDEMKKVYRNEAGGYGFAKDKMKYIYLLEEVDRIVEEKEEITDIVTVCGYNDYDYIDDVYREMKVYVDHIRKNYPDARIWIMPVEWTTNENIEYVEALHTEIKKSAHKLGVTICSDIENTIKNGSISNDTVHPNRKGHMLLANAIASALQLYIDDEEIVSVDGYYYIEKLDKRYLALFKDGFLNTDHSGSYRMNGHLYLVKDGVIDFAFSGTVRGTIEGSNKVQWLYVKNGEIDQNYTGFARKDSELIYFENGHVDFLHTGFYKDGSDWFYVDRSRVDFKHDGLIKGTIDGVYGYWYVRNSRVYFSDMYVKNDKGWWFIRNGCVDYELSEIYKWIITEKK